LIGRHRSKYQPILVIVSISAARLDGADESFIKSFIQHEGEDYDRDQLLFLLRDFLFAGTETSSTTIQWALVMLANHPAIQKRLQVTARNSFFSLEFLLNCTYILTLLF